jgi:hypothetical protein
MMLGQAVDEVVVLLKGNELKRRNPLTVTMTGSSRHSLPYWLR